MSVQFQIKSEKIFKIKIVSIFSVITSFKISESKVAQFLFKNIASGLIKI